MKPICSNCRKEVLKITNLDLFNGRLCPSCYNKFSLEENEIIQSQSEKEAGIWVRLDELVSKIMIDNYDTSSRDYEKTKRFVSIYLGKIFKNTPLFQSGKVHGGFVRYLFEPTRLIKFLEIRDYLSYFNEKELIRIVPLSIQSNQSHHTILSIQSIQKDKLIVKEAETDRLVSMDRLETGQDLDNFDRDMVWEGIKFKSVKEVKGFSPYSKYTDMYIGSNTIDTLDRNNKEMFSKEEIEESGLNPELIQETLNQIKSSEVLK